MLHIVQMADFHFGAGNPSEEEAGRILKGMAERIRQSVPRDEPLLLCGCGDYIDSPAAKDIGVKECYEKAERLLREALVEPLKREWKDRFYIGLCPGNHDITHLEELNSFSRSLAEREIDRPYHISIGSERTDVIFINSCADGDYTKGTIDYERLDEELAGLSENSSKFFVLHHTVLSMDNEDDSSIRNAPEFIKRVDQYQGKAILHGHTHGQYIVQIGAANCPILGVGAVISRNHSDVNSQFNLLDVQEGVILSGQTYRFHADDAKISGEDGFQECEIPGIRKRDNYFAGESFSDVYDRLLRQMRAEKDKEGNLQSLYHVHLDVFSDFDSFESDIMEHFGKLKELGVMNKRYSYYDLGKMWENPKWKGEVRDVLYFNHGTCFPMGKFQSGTAYIIDELRRKQTSSRAVLVTINMEKIWEATPDAYLPSLLSIQFGLDKEGETLHISMTLRALEASRFLKINICEVLYLAQQIHAKLPFRSIEVSVSAFRVQYQEQFGCFLRAKIDTTNEVSEISDKLSCLKYGLEREKVQKEIQFVMDLISDKMNREETVVETCGTEGLKAALETILKSLKSSPEQEKRYGQALRKIYADTKQLLVHLGELRDNRTHTSEPTREINALKRQIQEQYETLLQGFRELIAL